MNQPKTPSIFVTKLDKSQASKLEKDLVEQGFDLSKPAYTHFSAKKKGISCTFYESGKLTVQGKEMASFIEFYLEPEILKGFDYTYKNIDLDLSPRMGVDETGKGDFFGPLCIAAVFAEGEDVAKLQALGVCDSKKLSDPKICDIARKIETQFAHHIVRINPLKYNELYQKFKNLNRLLAWGHATVIKKLHEKTGCKQVIVDQFGDESLVENALGETLQHLLLKQRHRAEEDLVVAAASILARKAFLEGLEKLGKEIHTTLPKGAGSPVIEVGKKLLKELGEEGLEKIAKMHFKTLETLKKL